MGFEIENCSGNGSSMFGGVLVFVIIVVGVEVVDVGNDGVLVGEIGSIVLLVVDLVFGVGIFLFCN